MSSSAPSFLPAPLFYSKMLLLGEARGPLFLFGTAEDRHAQKKKKDSTLAHRNENGSMVNMSDHPRGLYQSTGEKGKGTNKKND